LPRTRAAGSALTGQGAEGAAARIDLDLKLRFLERPVDDGQRTIEAAWAVGRGPFAQLPWHDHVRNRRPRGDDPVIADDADLVQLHAQASTAEGRGRQHARRSELAVRVVRIRVPDPEVEVAAVLGHSLGVEPVEHSPEGHGVDHARLEGLGARVVGRRHAREYAAADIRGDLVVCEVLTARQLGAPGEDLEHLTREREVGLLLRGGEEHDGDDALLDRRGDAKQRRRVIVRPQEPIRRDQLDADGLVLRAAVATRHGPSAQVLGFGILVEEDGEAGCGLELAACGVEAVAACGQP